MKKLLFIPLFSSLLLMCSKKEKSTDSVSAAESTPILPKDTTHLLKWKEKITGAYPVFVTKDIRATKDFYQQWFAWQPLFESTWFILLASPGEHPVLLGFIHETHPSSPPEPKAFNGDGAFFTLDVNDATSLYEAMKESGARFAYTLKDEPWGQRRFALKDPNGIWIDVVEQIPPHEGWWDQYLSK
jgi:catechol 2,3-dioxygenase-like lactoylglutathione lyase family enzyme